LISVPRHSLASPSGTLSPNIARRVRTAGGSERRLRNYDDIRRPTRLETRQDDHDSVSRTDSNRRRWHASNPGSTIRIEPRRCRSSIPTIGTDAW
jgi:hypothetical protein